MKKTNKNNGPATTKVGIKPSGGKPTKKRRINKKSVPNTNKSVAVLPSASLKKPKASTATSIEQLFPHGAICQICKHSEAKKFAEMIEPEGKAQIHKFVCIHCSKRAMRTFDILKFFSSPQTTVATLAHMENNSIDWKSFGKMMNEFCGATGCFDTAIA